MAKHAETSNTGPYFLGVDGGASKTLAVVVDADGNECGRGLGGSANYAAVGIKRALVGLKSAVQAAAEMAECSLPFDAAWIGLAGIDRDQDCDILLPHLGDLATDIHLTNDAELLLTALDDAVGVALIAGTGSIALGRDTQGATARSSGWGHIAGDEGSGYDIGRMALQAAARAADGRGEPTKLLDDILHHWNLSAPSDIIGIIYQDDSKARIARLTPLVFAAARSNDAAARQIVAYAARELALAARTVSEKLVFDGDQIPLALGGGMLLHETYLREQVLIHLRETCTLGQIALADQPALSAAQTAGKRPHPGTGPSGSPDGPVPAPPSGQPLHILTNGEGN
ncbi:MAG TPA: BadF/BadG/BcrA/BcrD ATPase family protein [Ktedonobacterales bacterium]|nr:BadF/BadG/BcrA/BcrD ATPase family protein [Ktedonobacterales bacterium]